MAALQILGKIYETLSGQKGRQQKTQLQDSNGNTVSAQFPLAVDGDSIYAKDINLDFSDIGDFSGEITDLVDDLQSTQTAFSVAGGGVNPKSFAMTFHRPISSTTMGLSSLDTSISNAKITLKTVSGATVKVIDYSTDSTKRQVQVFQFPQQFFTEILVEFFTDDAVTLNGCVVLKSVNVNIDAISGIVSTENSSTSPLLAGEVFTGEVIDTKNYGNVICSVYSDAASIDDGLVIEFSSDKINWYWNDVYTIGAGESETYSIQTQARWMRIRYINGDTDQTAFDLSTILKPVYTKPSSHRVADRVSGQDDAELTKSVLSGVDKNGLFQNVKTTIDGSLTVTDNSSGLSIAEGNVTGKTFVHKFGKAPDFDVSDGFVDLWDGAEDGTTWESMRYTYSTTNDIDRISSNDNGDTVDIEIQGLDANYDLIVQTITLTGQTPAVLTNPLIRVFRLKNVGSTDLVGYVFCFVNVGVTGGVPNTAANIRAIIHPGGNQTLMAIYTIPNGKVGYMRDWFASTAGAKRDSGHEILLFARPFGQVFQLKHDANIVTVGTSYIQHSYAEPEKFAAKTDIVLRANTDQDAAGVSGGYDIVLVDE